VGVDRVDAHGNDGVLAVLSFNYSALAYGEGRQDAQDLIFGAPSANVPHAERMRFKSGYLAGVKAGEARCLVTEWRLG
jgi:hypothetical protein